MGGVDRGLIRGLDYERVYMRPKTENEIPRLQEMKKVHESRSRG